ncbi:MAG: DUF4936 family protein [Ideonella sp.]|nr:DUF4936 family protein [Ideonella sp.]
MSLPAVLRALFVYYRVAEADAALVAAAVRQCHTALRRVRPDLQCQLWRRPELRDGEVTVMETYALPEGIGRDLADWIDECATSAVAPWVRGQRHAEAFVPL